MLTKEQIEKQLAYWRSNPGHGPTFADFEPVAETALDALAEVLRLREELDEAQGLIYAARLERNAAEDQEKELAEELRAVRADRDAALARVEKLRHQITEASDQDFIWGALGNMHYYADTTLDDYASAVSRAIRGALDEDARHG